MRHARLLTGLVVLLLALLAFAASAARVSAATAQPERVDCTGANNPRVFPPGSHPYGASYGDWNARWWQWAYHQPVSGHPLFDETGDDCAAGQSGPVWFLGGVFNVSGTATRDLCVVPAGKALFFPILNVEWDNICPPGSLSLDALRAAARDYMDLATDMQCEVDGRAIRDLEAYRVGGPAFGIELPDDNLWQYFGCGTPPGHYEPLVPDGVYVMLAPLTPGRHTIHFRGTVAPPVGFTLEITYHLTVAAGHPFAGMTVDPQSAAAESEAVPIAAPTLQRTWGQLKAAYR